MTLGHEAGDRLLQTAAERLQECIRQSDTVSRHEGDEFVALLDDCVEIDAVPCAATIVAALSEPFTVGDRHVCLSASIKIAVFPADATEGSDQIRAADVAIVRAQCAGRSGFQRLDSSTAPPENANDCQALAASDET